MLHNDTNDTNRDINTDITDINRNMNEINAHNKGDNEGAVLTVFFHGTCSNSEDYANAIYKDNATGVVHGETISALRKKAKGVEVLNFLNSNKSPEGIKHFYLGVDGVGSGDKDHKDRLIDPITKKKLHTTAHPLKQMMLGDGVSENIDHALEAIRQLINNKHVNIKRVIFLGWSRGAASCVAAAFRMYHSKDLRGIEVYIFGIDPVPGFINVRKENSIIHSNVKHAFFPVAKQELSKLFSANIPTLAPDNHTTFLQVTAFYGHHATLVGNPSFRFEETAAQYPNIKLNLTQPGKIIRWLIEQFSMRYGSEYESSLTYTTQDIHQLYDEIKRDHNLGYYDLLVRESYIAAQTFDNSPDKYSRHVSYDYNNTYFNRKLSDVPLLHNEEINSVKGHLNSFESYMIENPDKDPNTYLDPVTKEITTFDFDEYIDEPQPAVEIVREQMDVVQNELSTSLTDNSIDCKFTEEEKNEMAQLYLSDPNGCQQFIKEAAKIGGKEEIAPETNTPVAILAPTPVAILAPIPDPAPVSVPTNNDVVVNRKPPKVRRLIQDEEPDPDEEIQVVETTENQNDHDIQIVASTAEAEQSDTDQITVLSVTEDKYEYVIFELEIEEAIEQLPITPDEKQQYLEIANGLKAFAKATENQPSQMTLPNLTANAILPNDIQLIDLIKALAVLKKYNNEYKNNEFLPDYIKDFKNYIIHQGKEDAAKYLYTIYRKAFNTSPYSRLSSILGSAMTKALHLDVDAKTNILDKHSAIMCKVTDITALKNWFNQYFAERKNSWSYKFTFSKASKKKFIEEENNVGLLLTNKSDNFDFNPNIWQSLETNPMIMAELRSLLLNTLFSLHLSLEKNYNNNSRPEPNIKVAIDELAEMVKKHQQFSNQSLVKLIKAMKLANAIVADPMITHNKETTELLTTLKEIAPNKLSKVLKDIKKDSQTKPYIRSFNLILEPNKRKQHILDKLNKKINAWHFNPFIKSYDAKRKSLQDLETQIRNATNKAKFDDIINIWDKTNAGLLSTHRDSFWFKRKTKTDTAQFIDDLKQKYKNTALD